MKKVVLTVFAIILALAAVLSFAACKDETESEVTSTTEVTEVETEDKKPSISDDYLYSFVLKAVTADGTVKSCPVYTDNEIVGAALLEEGLIDGEDGPYGIYVKKVFGETADYEKDGTYWAVYVGGEYSTVGVDKLKSADIDEVEFRVEK